MSSQVGLLFAQEVLWYIGCMNPEKELYSRTDITQKLGIQAYILSLWEKEFALSSIKAADGQTLYTTQAITQLAKIKELIYEKGYSLEAAKKSIAENKEETLTMLASPLAFEPKRDQKKADYPVILEHLKNLQKQLIKLRDVL